PRAKSCTPLVGLTIVLNLITIVPMARTAGDLFGKCRRAVFGVLLTRADEYFHLRELARLTGIGVGALHRELAQLVAAGIVRRWQRGRQTFYQADGSCPIATELRSIATKTWGIADI